MERLSSIAVLQVPRQKWNNLQTHRCQDKNGLICRPIGAPKDISFLCRMKGLNIQEGRLQSLCPVLLTFLAILPSKLVWIRDTM